MEPAAEDTVQFSVLLRKNNKPMYREMAVPKESEIARNLEKQEEADRLEKERVKKLTLEINERQEEEEVNEAIAAVRCCCFFLRQCGKLKDFFSCRCNVQPLCTPGVAAAATTTRTGTITSTPRGRQTPTPSSGPGDCRRGRGQRRS